MSSTPPTNSTGSSAPLQDEHDALPPGTRLAEFEILRVLGVGGFGIVYLAMDHALDRLVAVKEYMPSMMAARGRGTEVSLRSSMHQDTFNIGLRSFVNEAKLLARFNHSSLVKVYRFWEANGTAYMAMPFYPGRTLKEERRSMLEVPSEAWLRGIVDPLLGAMEVLHKENVYHRDIAPDNILLLPDGPPVLLDFGAARAVIGDRTQSLTAVLKPSYAPIEQYADVGHLRQGPWTDLYALGAVLHFIVTGRPPTPSASRAVHDDQRPLTTLGTQVTGTMPLKVLKAIDWALTVSPHTRPQNVQQFRDALDGKFNPPDPLPTQGAVNNTAPPKAGPASWENTQEVGDPSALDLELTVVTQPVPLGQDAATQAMPPPPAAAAPKAAPATPPAASPPPPPGPPPAAEAPAAGKPRKSRALPPLFDGADAEASAEKGSRTGLVLAALGVVLVIILALGFALLKPGLGSDPAPVPAPPAAPAPASAATLSPKAGDVPLILPPTTPAPQSPAPAPAPAPVPTPVAPAPAASVYVPSWAPQKASAPAAPASAVVAASAPVVAAPAASAVKPKAPVAPRPRAPQASAAAGPAAMSPRDTCNARATGSMASCMRRLCSQGGFADHPQCAQLRREDEW